MLCSTTYIAYDANYQTSKHFRCWLEKISLFVLMSLPFFLVYTLVFQSSYFMGVIIFVDLVAHMHLVVLSEIAVKAESHRR